MMKASLMTPPKKQFCQSYLNKLSYGNSSGNNNNNSMVQLTPGVGSSNDSSGSSPSASSSASSISPPKLSYLEDNNVEDDNNNNNNSNNKARRRGFTALSEDNMSETLTSGLNLPIDERKEEEEDTEEMDIDYTKYGKFKHIRLQHEHSVADTKKKSQKDSSHHSSNASTLNLVNKSNEINFALNNEKATEQLRQEKSNTFDSFQRPRHLEHSMSHDTYMHKASEVEQNQQQQLDYVTLEIKSFFGQASIIETVKAKLVDTFLFSSNKNEEATSSPCIRPNPAADKAFIPAHRMLLCIYSGYCRDFYETYPDQTKLFEQIQTFLAQQQQPKNGNGGAGGGETDELRLILGTLSFNSVPVLALPIDHVELQNLVTLFYKGTLVVYKDRLDKIAKAASFLKVKNIYIRETGEELSAPLKKPSAELDDIYFPLIENLNKCNLSCRCCLSSAPATPTGSFLGSSKQMLSPANPFGNVAKLSEDNLFKFAVHNNLSTGSMFASPMSSLYAAANNSKNLSTPLMPPAPTATALSYFKCPPPLPATASGTFLSYPNLTRSYSLNELAPAGNDGGGGGGGGTQFSHSASLFASLNQTPAKLSSLTLAPPSTLNGMAPEAKTAPVLLPTHNPFTFKAAGASGGESMGTTTTAAAGNISLVARMPFIPENELASLQNASSVIKNPIQPMFPMASFPSSPSSSSSSSVHLASSSSKLAPPMIMPPQPQQQQQQQQPEPNATQPSFALFQRQFSAPADLYSANNANRAMLGGMASVIRNGADYGRELSVPGTSTTSVITRAPAAAAAPAVKTSNNIAQTDETELNFRKRSQNLHHAAKYRDRRRQRIEQLFKDKETQEKLLAANNDTIIELKNSIKNLIKCKTIWKTISGQDCYRCPACCAIFRDIDMMRTHLLKHREVPKAETTTIDTYQMPQLSAE